MSFEDFKEILSGVFTPYQVNRLNFQAFFMAQDVLEDPWNTVTWNSTDHSIGREVLMDNLTSAERGELEAVLNSSIALKGAKWDIDKILNNQEKIWRRWKALEEEYRSAW